MRKLSFIIILFFSGLLSGQSPHGESFNIECDNCHNPESWQIKGELLKFDHSSTGFELDGSHQYTNCRGCHENLRFSETNSDCFSCHQDIHQGTTGKNCENCHTPESWLVKNISQIHELSRFPLIGAHNNDNCEDCHKEYNILKFQPLGTECIDCHRNDYLATKNPPHQASGFSSDCESCHNLYSTGWAAGDFMHDFFPLTGGHDLDNCFSCHNQGSFAGLSTECVTCHQADYNSTTQPNHAELSFPVNCAECHTTSPGWQPASFSRHDDFYPLTGAHNLIRNECASCHESGYVNTPNECYGCHKNDYDNTMNPAHSTVMFSTDCESCHNNTAWIPATFDHDGQFFPIYSGNHNNEWDNCSDCHTNPADYAVFTCVDCHEHNRTEMDDEHGGINGYQYISSACFDCHPTGDEDGGINHSTTNFPLTGAHTTAACGDCHTDGFSGTNSECSACHLPDMQSVGDPDHTGAGFSANCEECHNSSSWTPANFDHDSPWFPINSGSHAGEWDLCSDCHNNQSDYTLFDCTTCHEHNRTDMDEEHRGVDGYIYQSIECLACHPTGEEEGSFNHATSNFPLTGSHITAECADCHSGGYQNISVECQSCHQEDYSAAPLHSAHNYPLECESCHETGVWLNIIYDHNLTGFALQGAHSDTKCADCHENSLTGIQTLCSTCHMEDYQSAQNPSHTGLGLSEDCADCHTEQPGWQPAEFPVHDQVYPLTGGHLAISTDCASCHNGNYTTTPETCLGCHETDYNSTTNPAHSGAGFGTDCEECHSTQAWQPAQFDHDAGYFPIYTGEHAGEWDICADCHTNQQNYAIFECTTCHEHNQQEMDEEHQEVQGYIYISQECLACHPDGTAEGSFNHSASAFPLTGAHVQTDCSECHSSGYQNTPAECFSCHNDDYSSAQNPDHLSAGLSNDCQDCHIADSWIPSTFIHSSTGFTLDGAHIQIQCSDCHQGTTGGLSGDCYSCHSEQFASAPDHLSQSYPTDCLLCHDTQTWQNATFDHDNTSFPLTGAHLATACDQCHTSGYSGTSSVCVDCHLQNYQSASNPDHQALSISQECQSCHSTNPGWEPALFPVHSNYYPLLGAHSAIADNCFDCHAGNYVNTPDECQGCHLDDYNSTTNPNHALAGFPVDCEVCHTVNSWIPSTFDHDNQYFPIYSGEHEGEWNQCTDCHITPGNFSVFSCINCHEHNQADMDEEHDEVPGYIYNSQACFDCHPDGDEKFNFKPVPRINK